MDITQFLYNFEGGTRQNRFVVQIETSPGPASDLPASGSKTGTGRGGQSNPAFNHPKAKSQGYTPNSIGAYPIHIRATSTPVLQMGVINVNYRGKPVPFPGDRGLMPNWEIIVMDDVTDAGGPAPNSAAGKNLHLHRAFMDWSRAITPTDARLGVVNFDSATKWGNFVNGNIWRITQLDHATLTDNNASSTPWNRNFRLFNCWPKAVGPLQFDMSADNAINYFKVTLAYTHMQPFEVGTAAW